MTKEFSNIELTVGFAGQRVVKNCPENDKLLIIRPREEYID